MIIEFLPIKIESTIDWTLLFGILAAIAFYFGKLINEVAPYREDKAGIYTAGINFMLFFIILPVIILYTFFSDGFIKIHWTIAFILHFILSWYLGIRFNAYRTSKIKLKDFTLKIANEKTQELYKKILNEKYYNKEFVQKCLNVLYYSRIPSWILLVLATLNYWLAANVLLGAKKPLLIFLSFLFLLSSMSVIAIFYSFGMIKKYPRVIIHFEDGKRLEGELLKIDKEFINILGKDRLYHILNNKVKFIEVQIINNLNINEKTADSSKIEG